MTSRIALAGASNFRDLGGVATVDGRLFASGRVYRSNQLSRLTEEEAAAIRSLGIASVCNLRSERERTAQPTRHAIGQDETYASPKPDTQSALTAIFGQAGDDAIAFATAFAAFYADMPESHAEEFTALFRLLVEDRVPLLVHCSAGKDRTGVACALILSVARVEREAVIADYLLSSERLLDDRHFLNMLSGADLGRYAGLSAACRAILLGTDRTYIVGMLDGLGARYGSVDGYLRDRLGFSQAELGRLRHNLIADPV